MAFHPDPLPGLKSWSPKSWTPAAIRASARQTSNVVRLLQRGKERGVVRDLNGLPEVLGRIGSLEVRLARTRKDIRRAQKLRYKVFYEEMSATPNPTAYLSRRDKDPFDRVCDHLLVLDYNVPLVPFRKFKPKVVGTYRLLRQDVATSNFGFYSAHEFDLTAFMAANQGRKFMELGRSCVLKDYRGKRTLDLLWQGIYTYMAHHHIDYMVGCASFEGVEPAKHALPLSFLHHYAGGTPGIQPGALSSRRVNMDRMPKSEIDTKKALRALPPLIKGYLRLGATFGDGAVIDRQFGTTDVLVVMKVTDIDKRYLDHYSAAANKLAA